MEQEIQRAIKAIKDILKVLEIRINCGHGTPEIEQEAADYRVAIAALERQENIEQAFEDMASIIRENGHTRCGYCILKDEPCFIKDKHLNAVCHFEYGGRKLEE